MSELVMVALISAGSAVVVALMTQFLATQAASRQADREAQKEALQWRRSEARRMQALHEARLRELFGQALLARWRILDLLAKSSQSPASATESAASAAGQAYAVALLELPGLRQPTKDYYFAVSEAQVQLMYPSADDQAARGEALSSFSVAFKKLEEAILAEEEAAAARANRPDHANEIP
jgi:hypothetical protein